jgi:hypothetical protein
MEEGSRTAEAKRTGEVAAAIKRSPIFWSAPGMCAMLIVVLAFVSFGSDLQAAAPESGALIYIAFILVALVEVMVMPWFFLNMAVKNQASRAGLATYYGIAMLGGVTPCALGLVYYFLTGNLPLSLLLYLIGLAHQFSGEGTGAAGKLVPCRLRLL